MRRSAEAPAKTPLEAEVNLEVEPGADASSG
jgi:hypothetical protein